MPCDCPHGCKEKTSYGNLKDHILKCPNKPLKCNVDGCDFTGVKDAFIKHI